MAISAKHFLQTCQIWRSFFAFVWVGLDVFFHKVAKNASPPHTHPKEKNNQTTKHVAKIVKDA